MFEVAFLGTSASAPSIQRNLTSTLIIHEGERFLIDCAEGTQRQLLRSGLGFKRLNQVFLTHGHLDHILGLGGLISTLGRWELMPAMDIYAGAWALERVRDLLKVVQRGGGPEMRVRLHPTEPGLLRQTERYALWAFTVKHRGPGNLGFTLQEPSRRPFLPERAEALGVPAGPVRRRLVEGQTVTLEDGRVVRPEEVLGPEEPGVKLSYIGDVGRVDDLVEHVWRADALICEATYLEADREMARQHGHITASQAGWLARQADVGMLYLNHISRRYSPRQVAQEARREFPRARVVKDLERVEVKRYQEARVAQGG